MGYYLDFAVDEDTGRPSGCPAFDYFNNDWGGSKVDLVSTYDLEMSGPQTM